MKAFVFISSLISLFLLLLVTTTGIATAAFNLFLPGNLLFPVQDFAEQRLKAVYSNPADKAGYLLELMERRLEGLQARAGHGNELKAMQALEGSVGETAEVLGTVSVASRSELQVRYLADLQKVRAVLAALAPASNQNLVALEALRSKIDALIELSQSTSTGLNGNSQANTTGPNSTQDNPESTAVRLQSQELIQFPPGSAGRIHAFYPLTGAHAPLVCKSCHNLGRYAGTPNQCVLCHILKMPVPHYPGDCGLCHSSISWTELHFDHLSAATQDCQTCHAKDTPGNHYPGQCSACHITSNWHRVTFDHAVAGAVDCQSCHTKDAPSNHYPGQCANCHGTTTWKGALFNHSGFTDCISCHASVAPAGHYSGQCSNCHATSGGWRNVSFNHRGFSDCIACHAGNAPGNHFPSQCSNCHSTDTWKGAVFNHAGFTDCISCHLKDRPGEHSKAQCSECHNTQGWGDDGGNDGLVIINGGKILGVSCQTCHSMPVIGRLKESIK